MASGSIYRYGNGADIIATTAIPPAAGVCITGSAEKSGIVVDIPYFEGVKHVWLIKFC